MPPTNHPGHILPQDTEPGDAGEEIIAGQPVSQDEVEELLYGDDRPVADRIARLREFAEHLWARQAGDFGGDPDSGPLLDEIERAIAELEAKGAHAGEPGMLNVDPLDHRETLSPDSDEREALEDRDEQATEEVEPGDPNLQDDTLDRNRK